MCAGRRLFFRFLQPGRRSAQHRQEYSEAPVLMEWPCLGTMGRILFSYSSSLPGSTTEVRHLLAGTWRVWNVSISFAF